MTTDTATPPATNKVAPILNLDELIEPGATWAAGGIDYEYVRWSSLGLIERRRIDKLVERMNALDDLPEPTEEEGAEYEALVVQIANLVTVGDVAAIIDEMDAAKRGMVVAYFLAWRIVMTSDSVTTRQAQAETWAKSLYPTPATSSPPSTRGGRNRTRASG